MDVTEGSETQRSAAGEQLPDAQRRPEGLPVSTSLQLVMVGRLTQKRIDAALARHGLTLRLFGALAHLARQPDLSFSDLARRAGVTAQSMHATIRQLQALRAVTDATAAQGRRSRLEVTRHGKELLARGAAALQAIDEELLAEVPARYRTEFRESVSALAGPPPRGDGG